MSKRAKERDEYAKWLRRLGTEIFEAKVSVASTNMDGKKHEIRWNDVKRRLTDEELEHLKAIAKHFLIRPASTRFGFNFGICFYAIPAKQGDAPEYIFSIDGFWLPEKMERGFQSAWKELSPLSHSKENRKLLKKHNIPDVKDKAFYEY